MFHLFLAKIFPMLAALITLLVITCTNLCYKKAKSKIWQLSILVFFFRSIFHTKKFSFLAGAVCKIFVIEKQNEFVAKGNMNYC